ncbi:MAG: DUF1015 domain-containing protein [Clostridia bacterium]|nr:DUF1015 domain-containing protein [Clostridia bacterium]
MERIFAGADLYLPADEYKTDKWPVIACDQYTSQPEKWQEMERYIGDSPSALRLILPEVYLGEAARRVPKIHAAMETYLRDGVLVSGVRGGLVLTERQCTAGCRLGLVMTVDLEAYDYSPGSRSPIRPTEGTVVERLPPRLAVRRGAVLEASHILLLCDDPERSVIEPVYAGRTALRPLYDLDLMLGGGRLRGWAVEGDACEAVFRSLDALVERTEKDGIVFAAGDGNHSLATAKASWEEIKQGLNEAERRTHPARFASVELINIYDEALVFEPIHRVVFGKSADEVLDILSPARPEETCGMPDCVLMSAGKELKLKFQAPLHALPVGTVQKCLDNRGVRDIDYVHGEDAVRVLAGKGNTGILLPAMDKALLFPAVEKNGALPRKTFSMGEAFEKRYYMEVRRIL